MEGRCCGLRILPTPCNCFSGGVLIVLHHVGCDVRASPSQPCLAVHCYRSLLVLAQLEKRLEERDREKERAGFEEKS